VAQGEGDAVSLVNVNGTAIFGAGSEWFWAMAQFLLVAPASDTMNG
jgi:hypothetical protein